MIEYDNANSRSEFENTIALSGILTDLKYTTNGELVGILMQKKILLNDNELTWYFPFVVVNPDNDLKSEIEKTYLNETKLEKGIDLFFNRNDKYMISIKGQWVFNDCQFEIINQLKEFNVNENLLERIKPFLQEKYVLVSDSFVIRIRLRKVM